MSIEWFGALVLVTVIITLPIWMLILSWVITVLRVGIGGIWWTMCRAAWDQMVSSIKDPL